MRFPVLSGLIDSRLHSVTQNIPLELRKHGQHACESSSAWGGEIERFAKRNEAHVERRQFLKRVNKVYERPSPAIKPPHEHGINLPPPRGFNQFFSQRS